MCSGCPISHLADPVLLQTPGSCRLALPLPMGPEHPLGSGRVSWVRMGSLRFLPQSSCPEVSGVQGPTFPSVLAPTSNTIHPPTPCLGVLPLFQGLRRFLFQPESPARTTPRAKGPVLQRTYLGAGGGASGATESGGLCKWGMVWAPHLGVVEMSGWRQGRGEGLGDNSRGVHWH